MDTATTIIDFINLESKLVARALARNTPMRYDFAVGSADGPLRIVTIHASGAGAVRFTDGNGTPLHRADVLDACVRLNARRPDTTPMMDNNDNAAENIANLAAAKGDYY